MTTIEFTSVACIDPVPVSPVSSTLSVLRQMAKVARLEATWRSLPVGSERRWALQKLQAARVVLASIPDSY
jgi:hypothetical protein